MCSIFGCLNYNNYTLSLEKFKQVMIDYYKYNKFSDYSDLDIELDIHIIYQGINFTDLNNYKTAAIAKYFFISTSSYSSMCLIARRTH